MCLVWGAEQWANGYRVIANRKIQPRQEDAGAQAAQRCSPHKVVSFLLFNSCNFCSSLPLKAVVSLSFCVKKNNPHMVPSAIHFHPCVREGVQTARCKADLLQRALCNGWRLSIDMRLHLRFFYDITGVTLSWSEAFDLTGVGPYFGHPQPLILWGWPLSPPFQTDRPCKPAERTLWLIVIGFYLSLSTHWMRADNLTLWPKKKERKKKQAPVFIIRNICVVIPSAVTALSTGNRISHLLCRVSSPLASQDIYCHCHNDLIEAKEPFVGLKLFALQMMAPVQGWLHLTAILKALFSSVILVNVKWIWH